MLKKGAGDRYDTESISAEYSLVVRKEVANQPTLMTSFSPK